jgi:hypothetical protein
VNREKKRTAQEVQNMEKFVPFEKLSKKARRELNAKKRGTWGNVKPVSRREENPKAYKRHPKHKGQDAA